MIEYKYKDEIIEFENKNFNPKHIFECGQAFRWKEEDDGSYTTVAFSRVINVSQNKDKIYIKNTSPEDFENIWISYFDLYKDYDEVKSSIPANNDMENAIKFGYGIRILKQEIFETIISFIISANNRIPMIKKSINIISEQYGKELGLYNDVNYFSFPEKEILAEVDPQDLREIARVGFRNERIVESSKMLLRDDFSEDKLIQMPTEELRLKLMELPGVGPKVADCILLFAFGRTEVFPVDVWIKRVMEDLYIKETVSKNKISTYAKNIFGNSAGYAQQYLFYYGRENDIGKVK